MTLNLFDYATIASVHGAGIAAIYFISRAHPLKDCGVLAFAIFTIASSAYEAVIDTMIMIRGHYSPVLLHVYTLFEFTALMWTFSFWQSDSTVKAMIRYVAIPVFILLWFSVKFFGIESFNKAENITVIVSTMTLMITGQTSMSFVEKQNRKLPIFADTHVWLIIPTITYQFSLLVCITLFTQDAFFWRIQQGHNILRNIILIFVFATRWGHRWQQKF